MYDALVHRLKRERMGYSEPHALSTSPTIDVKLYPETRACYAMDCHE